MPSSSLPPELASECLHTAFTWTPGIEATVCSKLVSCSMPWRMQGQGAGAVLKMNTDAQMESQLRDSNVASSSLLGRAGKQRAGRAVEDGTETEAHVSPVALEGRELLRAEPLYTER